MWFAEAFKPVVEDLLQLPQLSVLHPYDDGTVSVTCHFMEVFAYSFVVFLCGQDTI